MIADLLLQTEEQLRDTITATLAYLKIPYLKTEHYIVTLLPGVRPLICTHTDTASTHPTQIKELEISRNYIILDPKKSEARCLGADDRAGVWIALEMLKQGTKTDFNYAFFTGEERGAIGSTEFGIKEDLTLYSAFIGLDRASRKGVQNVATYGYDNEELTTIFTDQGYEEQQGSFTDCSVLAGESGYACVNLSIGYEHEHSPYEMLNLIQMKETLVMMRHILIPEKVFGVEKKVQLYYEPVVCESCGEHDFLYHFNGYMLCAACIE